MLHKRSCICCCFNLRNSSSKFYISCRAFPPTELSISSYCVISHPFSIKTVPPAASLSCLHSSMLVSTLSCLQACRKAVHDFVLLQQALMASAFRDLMPISHLCSSCVLLGLEQSCCSPALRGTSWSESGIWPCSVRITLGNDYK